jgi:sugar-specific transcriptional regulator TrmB
MATKELNVSVIERLQTLGLSHYEARLYLGLLEHGQQNGNELSRTSGVPSSKVYSTLDRLLTAGVVRQARHSTGSEYISVPPDELVARLRTKFLEPLDFLERTLPTLANAEPQPEILQITGRDAILDAARAVARSAESEIYASVWSQDLDDLRDELAAADGRGVEIFLMIYGDAELDFGRWQRHSYSDIVAARIGGHMLTLVADDAETLIAHIPDAGDATAVRTTNPVLCLVTEEYLRHDLLLQKAQTMTGFEKWDKWLHADDDVRALTLGRSGLAPAAANRMNGDDPLVLPTVDG